MAFIKLDTIVKQLCRRTGEPEYRNYDEILEHAVAACRQLNLLAISTVDYLKVKLNRYNAIDWPLSCVKPLMIGQERCGRIVTLSVEDNILPGNIKSENCTTLAEAEKNINSIFDGSYIPEYTYSSEVGELYGYGCGFNSLGYVTHDKNARQSYVKGNYDHEDLFVMIFKSDGVSDGLQYVPSEAEMCIKSFVLREYYTTKQPTLSDRQDRRYKEEFSALRKINQANTVNEWKDLFNNMQNSTP